ncbi:MULTISPECIES: M20/M25/M40 family metallo-hydrolase [Sphingomonas]|uniref:Carboxypeptidase Q n=2 Tax=Sphingomonas adhaesiva TaxID=28212 RepID=A0A2A4IBF4_9SPHN|nr:MULTISPECIES: M20/M25/M40 family metallo-hydrolase [Sphingomonas]PCG15815.1 peptidase M28 family protein [Sphingomonas adhaesiva]PZU80849.1 MAG: peptidase M28 family protein [Sphingomonas sp.]
MTFRRIAAHAACSLALPLALSTMLSAAPAWAQRTAPPPAPPVDPAVAALRDAALKDVLAYSIIEGLTTEVGQRLAGTEAEARARAWGAAKLKALGFSNVAIETYQMPVWVRGEETAGIVAPVPHRLQLAALGNSGSTGPKGLTAEVVVFPTFNDLAAAPDGSLAGKIAYVGNAMQRTQDGSGYGANGAARFVGPSVAARKGAAAIVIRSIGTDHHRLPHTGTTNFAEGQAPIPAAALSVSDAELIERLATRGQPIRLHLLLTPRQTGMHESGNVIAEVPGTDPNAGVVLIGGHLDSWDLGTGAIDDASGLAITTAAAKRILDSGVRPRRTIRVVWFGAEEVGGPGGRDYARRHGAERHALAAESDFGADRVWRFETALPDSAAAVGARLGSALAPLGIVKGSGIAGDGADIAPIIRTGVAGVDLNQSGLDYFDVHHTPDDTLDRVEPEALRQNVAAWTTMLAIVANAPEEIGTVTRPK